MYTRNITLAVNLDARPLSNLVKEAKAFACDLTIENNNAEARRESAKSLFRLQSLGLVAGTTVTITGQGEDERQAVDALVRLVEGFNLDA